MCNEEGKRIYNQEGQLYVKGRKDRIINIGGKKTNPREVEESIMNIPIAASWGDGNVEELAKEQSDIICDNMEQLKKVIEKFLDN